jgi:hypothetical protein
MGAYLESQGIHRTNDDGSLNQDFASLMQLGSSLAGAAAGALAGGNVQSAALGQNVALTATQNNYLSHNEQVAKDKAQANCSDTNPQACREAVRLDQLDQTRNQNVIDLAKNCTGDCTQVVQFISNELNALGCTGPYVCDDAVLNQAWRTAQEKAQALQPGMGPDDLLFITYGLVRGGISLVRAITATGLTETRLVVADSLAEANPLGGAANATSSVADGSASPLFRGTTEGFPGSAGLQNIGITPVSTDPAVSTVFGTAAQQYGNGVVHIAMPGDIAGVNIIEGNVLSGVEAEFGINMLPTQFANQASITITTGQARIILSDMGISIPSNITLEGANLTRYLENLPRLTPGQIQNFVQQAAQISGGK